MFRLLLVVGCLTLTCYFCSAGNAQPKDVPILKVDLPRSVKGHGEKVESAKAAALNATARNSAADFMDVLPCW